MWQPRHPLSTGLCRNLLPFTLSSIALWQLKQSAFPSRSRLFLYLAAWGSWHFTQLPSPTALWMLFAFPETIPSWHFRQILFGSSSRSLP